MEERRKEKRDGGKWTERSGLWTMLAQNNSHGEEIEGFGFVKEKGNNRKERGEEGMGETLLVAKGDIETTEGEKIE